jgi:hypothetical protein
MSTTTPGPHTGRPVTAPAYYLGRPASLWIAATRRRSGPAADPDAAGRQVRASARRHASPA